MTTPHERMRALRWGHELLASMAQDASLTEEMRSRAHELWVRYPAPDEIGRVLSDGTLGMPHPWVDAWIAARRFFIDLRRVDGVSEQLRRESEATLRHFAEESLLQLLVHQQLLAEWLELEERN